MKKTFVNSSICRIAQAKAAKELAEAQAVASQLEGVKLDLYVSLPMKKNCSVL